MAFPYSKQTWADLVGGGTPVSAARLNVLEAGVELAGVKGVASTPPASPVDGMIWRLPASSGLGVYWFFMYDSSQATNKWVFMGGAPWLAEVTAAESTSSTTYAALATAGPAIAIPRAGDYIVEIGGYMRCGTTGGSALMSYDIGGTGAVDADFVEADSATAGNGDNIARARVKALTAVTLTAKYKASTGTALFRDRWMRVTPVRII